MLFCILRLSLIIGVIEDVLNMYWGSVFVRILNGLVIIVVLNFFLINKVILVCLCCVFRGFLEINFSLFRLIVL